MAQTGSTQGVSVINVNDTNNDAKQAAAHLWLGKESDGLDLELPIRTLLYEPKRNDWLKHLSAKTHFDFLWGSWRWWWYQERWHWLYWLLQPWHWRHEREIRDQVQESRRKKKILGLWASWVGLTTCSSLVKVRILRKLVNSKVWNIIFSNNILWFKELKACIKLSDIEHCHNE